MTMVVVHNRENLGNIDKKKIRGNIIAPARSVSLNLAVKEKYLKFFCSYYPSNYSALLPPYQSQSPQQSVPNSRICRSVSPEVNILDGYRKSKCFQYLLVMKERESSISGGAYQPTHVIIFYVCEARGF